MTFTCAVNVCAASTGFTALGPIWMFASTTTQRLARAVRRRVRRVAEVVRPEAVDAGRERALREGRRVRLRGAVERDVAGGLAGEPEQSAFVNQSIVTLPLGSGAPAAP